MASEKTRIANLAPAQPRRESMGAEDTTPSPVPLCDDGAQAGERVQGPGAKRERHA